MEGFYIREMYRKWKATYGSGLVIYDMNTGEIRLLDADEARSMRKIQCFSDTYDENPFLNILASKGEDSILDLPKEQLTFRHAFQKKLREIEEREHEKTRIWHEKMMEEERLRQEERLRRRSNYRWLNQSPIQEDKTTGCTSIKVPKFLRNMGSRLARVFGRH